MIRPADAGEFDAVVVGAGPAGSLAAIGLARKGLRTAIVERAARGRDKCCGRCLAARVAPLLRRHGLLDEVTSLAEGTTSAFRLRTGEDAGPIDLPIMDEDGSPSASSGGWLVRRDRLDDRLFEIAVGAGAIPIRPASARLLDEGRADAARLRVVGERSSFEVRAPLVVAADGVGSGLARAAGLADDRSAGRKFGFAAALEGGDLAARLELEPDRIEMLAEEGGYLGLVRERGSSSRVHAAALVSPASPTRDPRAFVRRVLGDRAGADLHVGPILAAGPMPWRPRLVARGAIALVGDAAGYHEPFTGEGMAWALESADALLDAVEEHRGWNADAAATYASIHRRRVGRRRLACRAIAALAARPRWLGAAARAAARMPALGRLVAAGVGRG